MIHAKYYRLWGRKSQLRALRSDTVKSCIISLAHISSTGAIVVGGLQVLDSFMLFFENILLEKEIEKSHWLNPMYSTEGIETGRI